ncbi:galectin-4-like [Paroedura picta]|uniref:galectin-4-like n=1 Tax=Paroedura picta TaxID=143630 RepID=UPI0040567075
MDAPKGEPPPLASWLQKGPASLGAKPPPSLLPLPLPGTKTARMAIEPETFDMPFNRRIRGGLHPESVVVLEGLIPEQSKWFYIQFAKGQYERAKALRLEARFEDFPYLAIIKLNCFDDRPRIKESPLKPGRRFTIKISVTYNSYKIFANGRLLDEFPHCFPPKDAIFLEVDGDVMLEKLYLPPGR